MYRRVFSLRLVAWMFSTQMVMFSLSGLAADDIVRDDRPASWQDDAELTDVFFLNSSLGWAVGAQGVILRTIDGGQTWTNRTNVTVDNAIDDRPLSEKLRELKPLEQLQSKQLRYQCRFESVHFVDAMNGWVVGGYRLPHVNRSLAVIMKTNDGGLNWHPVTGTVIPAMVKVRFRDTSNGWALGQASNLYQSGMVYSADGGLTWSTQSAGKQRDWRDGEQIPGAMVMLDQSGQPAILRPEGAESSVVLSRAPVQFNDLIMVSPTSGFAVGDRGVIYQTSDAGLSWRPITELQNELIQQFDFHSIAGAGSKLWLAGKPGNRIFRLDQETGQVETVALPGGYRVNRIQFCDENHGWAVCSYGRILATSDGGLTWRVQRGGSDRVAMLTVASFPRSVGWQSLARYANDQQLLTAVVCRRDRAVDPLATSQAAERLGATLCVHLPRERWQLATLVREIRLTKPSLVVSDGSLDVETLIRQAVLAAADRNAFSDQIEQAGLSTWRVDRLASRDANGSIVFDSGQMLAGNGQVVSDAVAVCRSLVGSPDLKQESYRVENIAANVSLNPRELVDGLGTLGNPLPRRGGHFRRGNLEMIRKTAQKSKQLDYLAQLYVDSSQDLLRWRNQLQRAIGGLSPEVSGIWLTELAQRYLDDGNLELAAYSLQYLTERWPNHPFSPSALEWLVGFHASAEFSTLKQKLVQSHVQLAAGEENKPITVPRKIEVDGVVQTIWLPNSDEILSAGNPDGTSAESAHLQNLRRANQMMTRLRSRAPDLMVDPNIRFMEARINQQLQNWAAVQHQLKDLALVDKNGTHADVAIAAQRELGLSNISDSSQRAPQVVNRLDHDTWNCFRLAARPDLDGKLNDEIWQQALADDRAIVVPVKADLVDSVNCRDWVLLAYDDEFLFVAAKFNKIRGQNYEYEQVKRTRDPDLSRRDRLHIRLDLDRDYRTAYQFAIDHRGWAAEACAGCRAWNPKWFVEATQNESEWTLEIAIPLSEITHGEIQPNTFWAVDIERLDYDSRPAWQLPTERAGPGECDLMGQQRFSPRRYRLLRFQ